MHYVNQIGMRFFDSIQDGKNTKLKHRLNISNRSPDPFKCATILERDICCDQKLRGELLKPMRHAVKGILVLHSQGAVVVLTTNWKNRIRFLFHQYWYSAEQVTENNSYQQSYD
uniref:Uncharacterized protein n=1 Tax=Glossina pallidipes TaxID=7398 RepID=A0A1A9ZRF0_GLOPL